MQTRTIADMQVSVLCLGTMTFGTPVGQADSVSLVHRALDQGMNFIDTANMYEGYARSAGSHGGVAEYIVGKALRGRREGVIVATKVGNKVGHAVEDTGTSPAAIRKHLDLSLQRLGMDTVDLYYMHRPDPDTPVVDMLGAIRDAMVAGKIRHYGISNYTADQTSQLLDTADAHGLPRPVAHQPPYSLLKRDIETDLLPLCREHGIAVVPYQVLQGGLLTGKYAPDKPAPEGSRATEKPQWLPMLSDPKTMATVEQLQREAAQRDMTLLDYTLRTTLNVPGMTSLVLGVKRPQQIDAAAQAVA